MSLQTRLLIHPYSSPPKIAKTNIFEKEPEGQSPILEGQHLPSIYSFVGPSQVRNQLLSQRLTESKHSLQSLGQLQQKRNITKLPQHQQSIRGTMLRSTIMTKFTRSELKQLTRDRRNLQFFKSYEEKWSKQDELTKKKVTQGKLTLLERSRRKLQVMPNPEKADIIKNYVTCYWEMSLRNHNPTLKQHIKGQNRYRQDQLQALLQREEGIREVEQSMPRLPLDKLQKINPRELTLTGRNKLAKESASCDPSLVSQYTERRSLSVAQSQKLPPTQTWRSSYDMQHRYMADNEN